MASGGCRRSAVAANRACCGRGSHRSGLSGPFHQGNDALEREILELFAAQAPHYLHRLRTAATDADWKEAVHTIKGSAAAVGAADCSAVRSWPNGLTPGSPRPTERRSEDGRCAASPRRRTAACRQIGQMFARH